MKTFILKFSFLLLISLPFINFDSKGQTTITFDELTDFVSNLGETYDNSGFRFSIVKSGSATAGSGIKANQNGGFGGSVALSDSNFEVFGITGWAIRKVDGGAFQFISIFLQEGGGGGSPSGTVSAYKNGVPIGSAVNVDFNSATSGLKDFSGNPDFYDVDEVRIEAPDIYLFLDHLTHGSALTLGDEEPPVVTGITIQGTPTSTATTVTFTVNFSKNALNVSADDFVLTTAGAVGTIGTVTGSGSTYSVTVNDIAGEGTIRLDLKSGTDISNEDNVTGVPAYTSGHIHTVSACYVENFESVTAGATNFSSNGLDFALSAGLVVESKGGFGAGGSNRYIKNNNSPGSFSITSGDLFTMSTVDIFLSDLTNGDNPTAVGSLTVKGKRDGAEVFSIVKTNGFPTNTSTNSGFFTLDFTSDGAESYRNTNIDELEFTIADGFLELLIDNLKFCQEVSDIDDSPPAVQRILVAGNPSSTDASVQFEVLFDENAYNVSLDDFSLYLTGTATGTLSEISGSGNTYLITVSGISGEGSVQVRLNGGTDISDNLGNTGPLEFVNGQEHVVGACFIETFEDETDGATSFSGNGKDFSLTGNWAVKRQDRFGANASDYFLENNGSGAGTYTIQSTTSPVTLSRVALYLSSFASGIEPTDNGTITLTGKKDGTTVYSITKNSGFPTSFGTTHGFFTLDFANDGADDYSGVFVDALEIQLGGSFVFIALDNLEFCSDFTPPSGYAVSIDQALIDLANQTEVSFTFSGAEIGTTYDFTFSSAAGGTPVTGSGTITAEDQQITAIDLSGLENGTITLAVALTDESGNVGDEVTDTSEKAVNNLPVISPDNFRGDDYVELASPMEVASGITVSEPDGDLLVKATIRFVTPLKQPGDVLTIPDPSPYTLQVIDENQIELTGSADAATMTQVLRRLEFSSTSKDPTVAGTQGGRRIAITVEDEHGAVSSIPNNSHNIEVVILATNDAPEITNPGNQTVVSDTDLIFNATNGNEISLFDVDAGSNDLEVTLTGTHGTLTLGSTAGLTFITGSGTDDETMTFSGSQIDINSAFVDLTFTPTAAYDGPASIEITVDDQGHTGSGGPQAANEMVNITVEPPLEKVVLVTSANANGIFGIGDIIHIHVEFDGEVVVNTAGGTPAIFLETGAVNRTASYAWGSGTTTLSFSYTVQEGDESLDLEYTGAAALVLNGGTIQNTNGDDVLLELPTPGSANALSGQKDLVVDGIRPIVNTKNILVLLDAAGQADISPEDINDGSSDNISTAAALILELNRTGFGCDDVGDPVEVILTVTDEAGNSATASATVTVEDNVAPIVLTQNLTVQLDADGNASITPGMVDAGSHDACGIGLLELDITDFDCGDIGDNTVTLTVTDSNGNNAAATAIVTVEDNVDPVALTQDITVQLDADGNASITPGMVDAGSHDACGIASLSLDITDFACGDIGDHTVTLTVTDTNGNTSASTATIAVEDNIAPVAITQNITVQLDADGNAVITPGMVDAGSHDACGIGLLELDITEFDCGDIGDNTVTLTVTDSNGNIAAASATVTVEDNVAPVAITQNITVQLDADGNAVITPEMIDAGSHDACGIGLLELDVTDFGCGDIGDHTVTLTVTDSNGNNAAATATVTIVDNVDPVALSQDITVQLDADGNASITAGMVDAGSHDACGIGLVELDVTDFGCGDIGDHTVTLTVTDTNGNTATATATVTVEDNVAPVAITQNITVQLDADGNTVITPGMVDAGSHDACGIGLLELDITEFDCGDIGDNTVNLTVTDTNGNTAAATATVTVEDNVAPVAITQNITVPLDADGRAVITPEMIDAGSHDACGITSRILDVTDFDCGDIGNHIVTLTVTDSNGNNAAATAIVTIVDNVDPVALTQDITVQLDADGNASITPGMVDAGSHDACGIGLVELDVTDFGCGDIGDHTVTLTVTDTNGNTATATATVTVEDNVAPVAITQNITVQLDADGNTVITPGMVDAGSHDACGIGLLELDITEFDCGDMGDNTVTLTVTDSNGNTTAATAIVTVEDNAAPIALTQDITVQLDADGRAVITPEMIDAGSYDACGIASLILDITEFDCGDIGDNTVTLMVTDSNGNTAAATANVTVEDVNAPVPAVQQLPDIIVECQLESLKAPVALDVCGGEITGLTVTNFPITESTTVIWTYTDASGNSSSQTQQVDVVDDTSPVITNIMDDFTVILDGTYVLPDFTQTVNASDNCSLVSFTQSPSAGSIFNQSTEVEVSFEAIDLFGNSTSASFLITIVHQELVAVEDPEMLTIPWNTGMNSMTLPGTVKGSLSDGQQQELPVSWNMEQYDPLEAGLYQLSGTMELGDIVNPLGLLPVLTILVADKLLPTEIQLSGTGFPANIGLGTPIGTLNTLDPQDDVHVYYNDHNLGDNRYFLIAGNHLYWNSSESLPGKTTFTVVITSTDRVGNTISQSFTLERSRIAIEEIFVPNTFSPNNDGVNDTWGVPDLQYYHGGRLSVYERSGKRVFYTEKPSERWDGTYNGKQLPVGTYFWVIDSKETGEIRRGILNLFKK